MSLLIIMVVMGAIALVMALFAMKLLFRSGWFFGWFKGTIGLMLFAGTCILGILVFQLKDFNVQQMDQSLGHVAISKIKGQQFKLELSVSNQPAVSYTIEGDFWTTSYRMIDFSLLPGGSKIPIVFQLEGASGRYMTLEQELNAKTPPAEISTMSEKVWPFMVLLDSIGLVNASIAELEFVPLVDGSLFDVHFTSGEIGVSPLNEPAEAALSPLPLP